MPACYSKSIPISNNKRYIGFGDLDPIKFRIEIVDDIELGSDIVDSRCSDNSANNIISKSSNKLIKKDSSKFTEHINEEFVNNKDITEQDNIKQINSSKSVSNIVSCTNTGNRVEQKNFKSVNTSLSNIKYNIVLNFRIGDILDAPDNSVLIHMTNCSGVWKNGIGSKLALIYPKAYAKYKIDCKVRNLLGKCILIPPSEDNGPKHYIACLFTHNSNKSIRCDHKVMKNLISAVDNMFSWISFLNPQPREIRMCKVYETNNKVPWEKTRDTISEMETARRWTINVIDRT